MNKQDEQYASQAQFTDVGGSVGPFCVGCRHALSEHRHVQRGRAVIGACSHLHGVPGHFCKCQRFVVELR